MNRQRVQEMLAKAESTNLGRDNMEREVGFGAVGDLPDDIVVRTAICALECALLTDNWDCVAEATAMLAKIANYYPWKMHKKRA